MKKDILSLMEETPQKNYYTYTSEGYHFIGEILRGRRMGLLTAVSQDVSELADELYVHHTDILKDTYYQDHELGVVFRHKTSKAQFLAVLDEIVTYFKKHQVTNVCCVCHQHQPLYYAHDEEAIDMICEDCFKNQPDQEYRSRDLLGFFSAFLLCLIPAIIWAELHDFGLVIIVDGLLYAYCSFRGYLILGENMDRYGLIMSIIASLASLCGAQIVAFAIEVQSVFQTNFKASISLSQGLAAAPSFIDGQVLGVTLQYFIGCLAFMAVGYILLMHFYKKRHSHRHCHDLLEKL